MKLFGIFAAQNLFLPKLYEFLWKNVENSENSMKFTIFPWFHQLPIENLVKHCSVHRNHSECNFLPPLTFNLWTRGEEVLVVFFVISVYFAFCVFVFSFGSAGWARSRCYSRRTPFYVRWNQLVDGFSVVSNIRMKSRWISLTTVDLWILLWFGFSWFAWWCLRAGTCWFWVDFFESGQILITLVPFPPFGLQTFKKFFQCTIKPWRENYF